MLTPAKIKNHHFDASGRNAYKAESVDSFFEEVAESYEQMFRENGEMYKKMGLLAERVEEYRKDEDNIRNALLTAQRMAEQITNDAQQKADTLVADAEQRAKTENDRTDAVINDMMQKATYQAQAIIEDAKAQAEKIIYDATHESKEAAVSARDTMIKEEAALQMMQVEVTKFKKQILDAYNEQLALIEQLPEIVYQKIEEEKAAAEAEEAEAEEIEAEEPEAEAEEAAEEIAEEVSEESGEAAESFEEAVEEEADEIDVAALQDMLDENEDNENSDDADEEIADEAEEESDGDGSYILPDIDAIDEEIERLSREIAEAEAEESTAADIPVSKKGNKENGFSVNLEEVAEEKADDEAEEIDDDDEFDEEDEEDDDNGGSFSSKLKGFFRK